MYNIDYSIKNFKCKLAELAIFLIPFDSTPLVPGGSTYKPLSMFPLLLYYCLYFYENLINKKTQKLNFYSYLLFIYIFCISLLKSVKYETFEGVMDFFVTGFLGIIFLVSFSDYFAILREKLSHKELFEYVSVIFRKSMLIPFIYGFLQVSTILFGITFPYANSIYHFATYRYVNNRVFLVCGEPAWASVYLLIYIFFTSFSCNIKYKKIKIIYSVLLLFFTFSMFAYLAAILVLFLYCLFKSIKDITVLKKVFFIFIIFVCILFILDYFILNIESDNYAITRYKNMRTLLLYVLSPKELYNFIQIADESIFIRMVNPVIAIMISFTVPVFGTGAGYFYKYYPDFIRKYFPLSVSYNEVRATLDGVYQITPRNLFCKFFVEYGLIIGSFLFLRCILLLGRVEKNDNLSLWLLAITFGTVFNFDSLCFVVFIFLLTFFISYTEKDLLC